MEIIGDKSRLVGLNFKVNETNHSCCNAKVNAGEILKIKGIENYSDNWSVRYTDLACIYHDNCKILLDETFLEKFKSENIAVEFENEEDQQIFLRWCDPGYKKEYEQYLYPMTCWDDCCHLSFNDDWMFKDDYTIIKFKDCILPEISIKEYLDTEEGQEFIKYWKQGNLNIQFDNEEDKSFFWKLFKEENYYSIDKCNSVVYENPYGILHANPGRRSIKYKDIKDWRNILGVPKEFPENKKEKKTVKTTYKIIKPISIKNIMEAEPCNSEGEVDKFIKEFLSRGNSYNDEITTWEEFTSYDILVEYKQWFIDEDFLEKEVKFEPFDLTLRIETEDELKELWCRLNINDFSYNEECRGMPHYVPEQKGLDRIWKVVDDAIDERVS